MTTPAPFAISPLTPATWPAFAALVEANGGIFGGCWCIGFHAERNAIGGYDARRATKEAMVLEGRTHHALVFHGDACLGWAQFGTPGELPAIKNRKVYDETLDILPDWRITCLFIDKNHRGKGVAKTAVEGALELIRKAGGGVVETYPQQTEGAKISSSFLYNGTRSLFESCGFKFVANKGKNHCIMRIIA